MKKIIFSLFLALSALVSPAQTIRYPLDLKDLFERSDRVLSDLYYDASERFTEAAPAMIGIYAPAPDTPGVREIAEAVVRKGMNPVVLPFGTEGIPADSGAATDEAIAAADAIMSTLSGVVFPDGAVRNSDPMSLIYFKSVCDWNVPFLGDNPLTQRINRALWRCQNKIPDLDALLEEAALYHRARLLQKRIFLLDTHADLPDIYNEGFRLGRRSTNQVSLRKMMEGGLDGTFLISYQGEKDQPEENAFAYCVSQIDKIYADVRANEGRCEIVTTPAEALRCKAEGKRAFFIGIENGKGIGRDIRNLRQLAERGVRYVSLTHTYDNIVAHSSSHSADTTRGLTPYGREVVAEMNRLGIMVDCSHASSGTFWDCIAVSKAPVICSHSGAKKLFNHNRNITDDQLRALRDNGGVIQIYAVWNFQSRDKYTTDIETYLDHIDHCVRVAGIDHVGIGIDMDGGGGYTGVFGSNDAVNITMGLLRRGYSDGDIEKIWSGNVFRVLERVIAMAGDLQRAEK
ncbi:MAG: dipeptidase [Bacteroidales bacterium]|nr:dipeptidase [Bacteroidales bacterium]